MTTLGNTVKTEDAFGVVDGSEGFGHDVDADWAGLFTSWGVTGGAEAFGGATADGEEAKLSDKSHKRTSRADISAVWAHHEEGHEKYNDKES